MTRIAIIGIGCRFPGGADDASSYWSMLRAGRCAIRLIPADRWSLDGFWDPRPDLPDRSYSKWGGFLEDIRSFDAGGFGLSPREAAAMDPQQRLLLMVASEAIADARLPLTELRRARAGVFIGVSNTDYGLAQRFRHGMGDISAGTGTALSIVANRVSNRLDLTGPSLGVDTACSSSLVALDTACRHLGDGSCGIALAGGVNILLDPRMFITFSRAHMLSPTGRIRAFDASADGFVRGEGVGVVVLRPLDQALAAGDRIYAVIDATAVNQDGRTGTITEPSPQSQVAMLRAAAERAGIDPQTVDYVEAHGTGTPVGDPVEANAIGAVFGGPQRSAPIVIGSVKTNLGHLEPAAGIAGLIKAALVLHHRHIPASLGFERANPTIDIDGGRIEVAAAPRDMRQDGAPVRALVNSFGFGGTNACALLSSARDKPWRVTVTPRAPSAADRAPWPVPLSAPTQQHLQRFAASLATAIESGALKHATVDDIAGAITSQRDHSEHRAVVIASTPAELRDRLLCLAEGRDWPAADRYAPPQILTGRAGASRRIVFTMTGQGGQWWSMGRELLSREPVFQQSIEEFDRVFQPVGGWSVMDALLADEAHSRIDDAAITPAVMLAFQTALAAIWQARGVRPDIVLGHSFGEVTAAFLAGGIGQQAVARLVTQRGLIRGRVDRVGTMAAIGLSATAIAPLLPADGSVEIGGYNAPDMVTLTGEEAAIDRLIARLNADDPSILTRKLALDFAYHSSWFEPVEHIFKADVGILDTAPPVLPVISTVTGELNQRFDADYWWQNLRHPVRYQQAIERALELGGTTFVELGPHRTLSSMTAACAAAKGKAVTTVSSLDRRWGDLASVAVATGQLYVCGVEIDWRGVLGDGGNRQLELPRQPWVLEELWSVPEEAARFMRPPPAHPLLGQAGHAPTPSWHNEISLTTHAFLGDHRIDGDCVFPAAGYLDMMTAAARELLRCEAIELIDVAFPAALYIGGDDTVQLATTYDTARRRIAISSRLRDGGSDWQLRAQARIFPLSVTDGPVAHETIDASIALDHVDFYRAASDNGFGWGPQFQGLRDIVRAERCATARLAPFDPISEALQPFALDPRMLDSALQLMLVSEQSRGTDAFLPVAIARVAARTSLGTACNAFSTTRPDGDDIIAEITIASSAGATAVRIEGIRARRKQGSRLAAAGGAAAPRFYRDVFELIASAPLPTAGQGTWLILALDGCRHARRIADALEGYGHRSTVHAFDADAANDRRAYIDAVRSCFQSTHLAGIVYALPLGLVCANGTEIGAVAKTHTIRATAFAQALSQLAEDEPLPPVSVLTARARSLGDADRITDLGLAQSPLTGFFRTVAMEVPEATLRLVDIDEDALQEPAALIAALASDTRESEILIRAGTSHVPRLVEPSDDDVAPARLAGARARPSTNLVLRHRGLPGPDGLHWREARSTEPGPNDVTIEVAAVGLNFRDVMAVAGLLPDRAEPSPAIEALGLEISGVVAARGGNVQSLDIGDRVIGMGRGGLQRLVTWPAIAFQRCPAGLSHISAATMPSAFLTAHHALNRVGRVKAGECILVHSATGGVGLAAVALAKRVGAHVIATAGSPEKRNYLARLGIEHVFDSRTLGFADDVMRATGGRGVDVVLNSLQGPFIEKGLMCLAPYGRFIELGKRDVYDDTPLGLGSLRRNASYHVVDLAALIAERPGTAADMMREVLAMHAAQEIWPLPASVFPASEVSGSFRHFASARHIGKVVVEMDTAAVEFERGLAHGAPLDPNATYLVTGGTSGFGRAVGDWLAARGAGRVVLASRRADARGQSSPGGRVVTLPLDVTDAASVDAAVASLALGEKPLRGIVHAAVVYDDGLLTDMTAERVGRVLAPKITGALNLTRAVEACGAQLDFFVTFSSMAQVVGWPGQSNYAAANSFLEGLSQWQRSRGIPGQCINWGALCESGHVARNAQMQSYLDSAGFHGIDNETALSRLAVALDCNLPVLGIAASDWCALAATHRALARSTRLAGLVSSGMARSSASAGLSACSGAALAAAALDLVHEEAAKVLRTAPGDLASCSTLAEAGIDSLSSFELKLRIEQSTRLSLPMARFARAATFADVAALVAATVEKAATDAAAP